MWTLWRLTTVVIGRACVAAPAECMEPGSWQLAGIAGSLSLDAARCEGELTSAA